MTVKIIMTPPVAMTIIYERILYRIALTARMVKSKEKLNEETSVDVVICFWRRSLLRKGLHLPPLTSLKFKCLKTPFTLVSSSFFLDRIHKNDHGNDTDSNSDSVSDSDPRQWQSQWHSDCKSDRDIEVTVALTLKVKWQWHDSEVTVKWQWQ